MSCMNICIWWIHVLDENMSWMNINVLDKYVFLIDICIGEIHGLDKYESWINIYVLDK